MGKKMYHGLLSALDCYYSQNDDSGIFFFAIVQRLRHVGGDLECCGFALGGKFALVDVEGTPPVSEDL